MSQWYRVVVFCMLSCPALAFAAEPGHPCALVVDPGDRLVCYDEAFPPPAEVHQAAAKKAIDEFGLGDRASTPGAPAQGLDANDPGSVVGLVAGVDYGSGGRRRVLLENGQAWTLTESSSAGPLKPGDEVLVRKGLMGSYLLRTPSGVSLRVRRTR